MHKLLGDHYRGNRMEKKTLNAFPIQLYTLIELYSVPMLGCCVFVFLGSVGRSLLSLWMTWFNVLGIQNNTTHKHTLNNVSKCLPKTSGGNEADIHCIQRVHKRKV